MSQAAAFAHRQAMMAKRQAEIKAMLERSAKWPKFYPQYINSESTIAHGRKLPKSKCCEYPEAAEMMHIAKALELEAVLEMGKRHPRAFMFKGKPKKILIGRVRVKLWDEKGEPINKSVPTRRAFLEYAGENIPKLKVRHQRLAAEEAQIKARQDAMQSKGKGSKKKKKKRKKKGKR